MKEYHVQECILAAGEYSLYHALTLVIAQRALLLPKMPLHTLVAPTTAPGKPSSASTSRTTTTVLDHHVADFVLCDRRTTRPLAVILVDGSTKSDHVEVAHCDSTARLCEKAGLRVLRIHAKSAYRMDLLQRLIEPLLTDDPRGRDYEQGDRLPTTATTAQPTTAKPTTAKPTVAISRPGTLFSSN